MKKKNQKFHLRPLDWLCVVVGVAISVLTVVLDRDHSPFYMVTSIIMLNAGVLEVIFLVNGRRINYIFSLICAISTICVSFIDHFYGNMATNAYYVIISIIGFYLWGKHSDKNKDVVARKLSLKQIVILLLLLAISSTGLSILLRLLGGHSIIADSISTILVIVASSLGVLRYREQWIVWVLADVILLAMWVPIGNPAVIAMRVLFLLSSFYGYYNWRKFIKKPKTRPKTSH